jgi:hypothetical protein
MAGPLPILLYGATGRAASLILDLARDRGVPLILGGRDETRLETVAARLGLEARHFDLETPSTIDACLEGVGVVLNCAGPFALTALPLVEGCLRTRTHYVDLTDDAPTLAAIAARGDEAAARGVMLLPSAGFASAAPESVALLISHLAPSVNRLDLILCGGRELSRPLDPRPLTIEGGRLAAPVPRPASRRFDVAGRHVLAAPLSHAALVTAHAATDIAAVGCWRETSRLGALAEDASRLVGLIDRRGRLAMTLSAVGARISSLRPTPEAPANAEWLGIGTRDGEVLAALSIEVDSVDRFTAHAALRAAIRAARDSAHPGFQTPAGRFGPDEVLALPGVKRVQLIPVLTPGTRRPAARPEQG